MMMIRDQHQHHDYEEYITIAIIIPYITSVLDLVDIYNEVNIHEDVKSNR